MVRRNMEIGRMVVITITAPESVFRDPAVRELMRVFEAKYGNGGQEQLPKTNCMNKNSSSFSSFGMQLDCIRERLGVSIEKLAARAGVSQATIYRYMKGNCRTSRKVERICKALEKLGATKEEANALRQAL